MQILKYQIKNLYTGYIKNYQSISKKSLNSILICLLQTTATGLAFYLSIYLVSTLHYSVVSAGIVLSCYGVGTMLGGIVGGKLSDKIAPTKVIIASLLIESILFNALPSFKQLHVIMLIAALLGVCTYMFKTANTIQLIRSCSSDNNHDRITAINILYTATNIGIGTSALLIGLFAHYGFSYLFYAGGMMTLLLAIHQMFFINHSENTHLIGKPTDSQQDNRQNKKIFFTVLVSLFITGLIIAQLRTTYSIYIHNLFPQYGLHGIGLLLAINPALIILFQTPLTSAIKHFNKFDIIGIGVALMGMGCLLLNFITSFVFAALAYMVYTAGEMLFFSMAQYVCYESSPPQHKGNTLGIFQSTYAASLVVGPSIGGIIYHHLSPHWLWYACGLVGFIALLICFYQRTAAKEY
ncbi:MAG: MFS transporter [Coxiellaceae bacterium]|nr:MFS transporter [Coxiellaceae bacterium]